MKRILSIFACLVIFGVTFAENTPKLAIKKCSTPPKVDGIQDSNDPWTDNWIPIDKATDWSTTSDMTAAFQMSYDDENLYLLIQVYDADIDTSSVNYPWYENDNVTFYIKTDTTSGETGTYGLGDYMLSQIRGMEFPDGFAGNINKDSFLIDPNFKIKQVDDTSFYTQEWQLPWDVLTIGLDSWEGEYIKMDIGIADNTTGEFGGRTQLSFWNSNTDEQWRNTTYFGLVQLGLPPVFIEGGRNKTIVCGEIIQLSVLTNFTDPGTISYLWSPSDGLNQNNISNPIVNTKIDKTYYLTVNTSNGDTIEDSVIIKVNPLFIYANNLTVTCGNEAQLDVSTNYKGSETLTYNWEPSANLNATNIKNPVATLTTPAVYSVEVTTLNGCEAQKNIEVNLSIIDYQSSICLVTVDDNNKNTVVWQKLDETSIDSFLIYRELTTQTDVYELIGSVASSAESVFTDPFSNALIQSNKYKIVSKDICGFITDKSIAHKTMHLNINKGQENSWNLIWEPYEGFDISSYKIYRGNSLSTLSMIGSTAGSANSYSDFTAPEGDIYYQVEVTAPYTCSTLKSTTYSGSRSNIASNTIISVPSVNDKNQFDIYPVPAKDILYIDNNLSNTYYITVLSIDGHFVLSLKNTKGDNKIDISGLPHGMYILKLSDNKGTVIQKFIKE